MRVEADGNGMNCGRYYHVWMAGSNDKIVGIVVVVV